LLSGNNANAELVLIQTGELAEEAIASLELGAVDNAELVSEIPSPDKVESEEQAVQVPILIVPYDQNKNLQIPLEREFLVIQVGYKKSLGDMDQIPYSKGAGCLEVETDQIRGSEVLMVFGDGELVAYVLPHNELEIKRRSASSEERRIYGAIGSLNTDAPEFGVLFDCIGRLMLEEKADKKHRAKIVTPKKSRSSTEAPDTLIAEIDHHSLAHSAKRRSVFTGGDIGLIMNALIQSMTTAVDSVSGTMDEDKYGRNEEELVGQDDEIVVDVPEIDAEKIKKLVRSKLRTTVKKLDAYLEEHSELGVHAALGVIMLVYNLFQKDVEQSRAEEEVWIEQSILEELLKVVTSRLYQEKNPFYRSEDDEPSVYQTDDWGRLLGYVCWLSYRVGITFHKKLPISADREVVARNDWHNALWVYLAQRVRFDPLAMGTITDIAANSKSENMRYWVEALLKTGEGFAGSRIPQDTGFSFALSPGGGFIGVRIVSEINDDLALLPTVANESTANKFRNSYLSLLN
jgi:hypothetical protein